MARLARAIFPGIPHHVTQRGNGGAQTFFGDDDYRLYRDLLAEHAAAAGVEVWSWVLMPNHVHLILVPPDPDALRRTLAAVHRRYAGQIHARLKRTGHFWQGRFGCVAMDEDHLGAALRYVALNPVRARLVARVADWPWSSAQVHLGRVADDGLTAREPVLSRYPQFAELMAAGEDEAVSQRLRRAETIGRPLGDAAFMARLERESGRSLKPGKRGPAPRAEGALE
jgi:putative transposase